MEAQDLRAVAVNAREQNGWQIVDVGSVWMREFASALCGQIPATAWCPEMTKLGILQNWLRVEQMENPPLEIRYFPLQRGYARVPASWVVRFERKMLRLLRAECVAPDQATLVCSTPFYAPLAEQWPGPVVYYSTDLTMAYAGLDPEQVNALDRRMCKVAAVVCPNSARIAEYFVVQAGCDATKITIVPNATRESNVAASPVSEAAALPEDVVNLPRPIAGVLGNLAGNMDWVLLAEAVRRTPWLTWIFVGPATMAIEDEEQSRAREWVRAHARFTGGKTYGELQAYARCLDVAVLPYMLREPTYSGSSTRFYEHLAACRPMVATRGFAELLGKEPLVRLVDTAEEMETALGALRDTAFVDGFEAMRWRASMVGTWEERARTMRAAVAGAISKRDLLKQAHTFPLASGAMPLRSE